MLVKPSNLSMLPRPIWRCASALRVASPRNCGVAAGFSAALRSPTYIPRRTITEEALLKSSNLGESNDVDETGFILKSKDETLLYYDRLTPVKSSKWDIVQLLLPFFYDVSDEGIKQQVLRLSQSDEAILPLNITELTSCRRDGGAFVKYKIPPGVPVTDFNRQIMENVENNSQGNWRDRLIKPRVFPVKGVPWIEDLGRYPSQKLKVEFEGNDLTQENLYALCRRYGKITEIVPPSPDSKSVPRHALVTFRSSRSAVPARQCLNGLQAGNTTLHIMYERIVEPHIITDYIQSHSRVFVPLLIALFAGLAVVIFDPIRHFCITEKITSAYSFANSEVYRELVNKLMSTRKRMSAMLGASINPEDNTWDSIEGLKAERDKLSKTIKIWLEENVNSFIVVQGPAGSGKRSLVQDQTLKDRRNVLYIDCEHIIKSRKEQEFVKNVASELGYFPVFPWVASFTSMLDLALQGMTGTKSGLTETKESQVKSMLTMTANAIRDIALKDYDTEEEEEHIKEEDYLRQNPDVKPIVVLDRYEAARNASEANAFVYKEFADWAASLITLGIAHVLVITDDVGATQLLTQALPTSPLRRAELSDADNIAAENYVQRKLEYAQKHYMKNASGSDGSSADGESNEKASAPIQFDTTDLFYYTDKLGGRMADLQMFVRRIQSGDSPKDAFDGLTQQAIEQLIQVMLSTNTERKFDRPQMWSVIKLFVKDDSVSFADLQQLPLLKVDTFAILQAMENSEVITLERDRGIIRQAKPAKPIYAEAFHEMVDDPIIYASFESDYLKTLISKESVKIGNYEAEIAKYAGVLHNDRYTERLDYLGSKIDASTRLTTQWEKKLASLSKPVQAKEKEKQADLEKKKKKEEEKKRAKAGWSLL